MIRFFGGLEWFIYPLSLCILFRGNYNWGVRDMSVPNSCMGGLRNRLERTTKAEKSG